MDQLEANAIVEAYRKQRWRYERLARLVRRYLEWRVPDAFPTSGYELLYAAKNRAKDPVSLRNNLLADKHQKPVRSYLDVKDLAGARLVFRYRDDWLRFRDKHSVLSEWFGYQSAEDYELQAHNGYKADHFPVVVCEATAFWRALRQQDQTNLKGLWCEVQFRTALQDAWAEADHPILYKLMLTHKNSVLEKEKEHWEKIAKTLERADTKIVQRKCVLAKILPYREEREGLKWNYDRPKYPSASNVGGTKYSYELLHSLGENSTAEIKILKEPTLFDVDAAIQGANGPPNYKGKMWEVLKGAEQEFLSTIKFDSLVVRPRAWDSADAKLIVQPARYSDQVVTNHKNALSYSVTGDPMKRRVEDFAYGDKGLLLAFKDSPLANTIGIACVMRTSDGFWAIALRSQNLAFDPGKWGCTASGALEWSEPDLWDGSEQMCYIKGAMARECEQEIGFRPDLKDIQYLAFARELGRAGKPQFFFVVKPQESRDSLIASWRICADDQQEVDDLLFINDQKAPVLVGENAASLSQDQSLDFRGAGLSEELRMNLALALQAMNVVA